jgi:hypothetical protein
MKLITTNKAFASNLSRLVKDYPHISFAVAWASANTEIFRQLTANPTKIQRAVIGTHFYQTHPDVIDAFIDSQRVHFILQPEGIFHPKVYLFWKTGSWEAIIGSANLTAAALTINSEAMILVSSSDEDVPEMRGKITELIDEYWKHAKPATKTSAASYRALWKVHQPALNRLSGQYGNTKSSKSPIESQVMKMTWEQFLGEVKKHKFQEIEERLNLLDVARLAFAQYMETGLRQTIAGVPTLFNPNWGWFGSMKGAGRFRRVLNANNPHLSSALDRIPSAGNVTFAQYKDFLSEFVKAFPSGGHGVAVSSRMLAMKRPDQFVCVASKNKSKLCIDFGIKKTGMDYERYWDEIIQRILDSPWWNSEAPNSNDALRVWNGRAAMLDVIYYNDKRPSQLG